MHYEGGCAPYSDLDANANLVVSGNTIGVFTPSRPVLSGNTIEVFMRPAGDRNAVGRRADVDIGSVPSGFHIAVLSGNSIAQLLQ